MSERYGSWENDLFYINSSGPDGTIAIQIPRLQRIAKKSRKWEEASTQFTTGSYLNDILTGFGFGNASSYKIFRFYHDYTFARLRFQKNTGTDSVPVWTDLGYIDTATGNWFFTGGITAGDDSVIDGKLTLGDNLDMNGFYIKNLGGINDIRFTAAGRTYTTTFSSQTSVTVNHNLNTLFPVVVVYQTSDGKIILPEDTQITSANQVVVTFGEAAVSGSILVAGGVGEVGISFTDGTHSFPYAKQLQVNPADFYITKSNDGNGYPVLNLQPVSGSGGSALTVKEIDGSPSATNVSTIRFSNGSVTDDGGGQVTVVTSGGGGDIKSDGSVAFAADESMGGFKLTNVGTPGSGGDAANKTYVDAQVATVLGGHFYAKMSDGTEFGESLIFATSDFVKTGHIVTVQESGIDHGSLGGLADDDHTQYTKADGTRAFTGTVGGVTPVASTDLATKGYIDTRFGDFYRNSIPTIRVRDIDTVPTVTQVNTIEFTNGLVSDQGNGVARVTISAGGGISTLTEGSKSFTSQTEMGVNSQHFYFSPGGTAGSKVLNLRYEKDIYPVYIDFPSTQQIAVIPIAPYPCTIESVQFDCLSGTATAGFYIVTAANRSFARDGTGIGGLDPLNISNTFQVKLATSNISVNTGDKVLLSVYQNSSARKVNVVLTVKKP